MKFSKYKNIKVTLDGFKFDSKKEARRYRDLKLLEKAGEISDLNVHPKFQIEVNGKNICTYSADFEYLHNHSKKRIVEDVKVDATKTQTYRLKKKLMEAVYGIDICEI